MAVSKQWHGKVETGEKPSRQCRRTLSRVLEYPLLFATTIFFVNMILRMLKQHVWRPSRLFFQLTHSPNFRSNASVYKSEFLHLTSVCVFATADRASEVQAGTAGPAACHPEAAPLARLPVHCERGSAGHPGEHSTLRGHGHATAAQAAGAGAGAGRE